MAWDSRGYYYQSKRVNGQPCRVYVGAGYVAELTAATDAAEQAERAQRDNQRRLRKAQDRAAMKDIDGQYRRLTAFVGELMTVAGYRQYNREWRKMGKKAAAQLTGPTADGDRVDMEDLARRVSMPNPSNADIDALRRVLNSQEGLERGLTVLTGSVIISNIVEAYTDSPAARLTMQADARRIAKALGKDTAPPFEQPLIDHVVVCWLRLQLVERDVTNNVKGAHNRDSGIYWDRRLTEAQRRYLRAVNLLAKVRHIGPAVQVNIAHQQVVQNNT